MRSATAPLSQRGVTLDGDTVTIVYATRYRVDRSRRVGAPADAISDHGWSLSKSSGPERWVVTVQLAAPAESWSVLL